MENRYTVEEFSLMLFKDMTTNLLAGLEDFIYSAHKEGLDEKQEYKDFIRKLKLLCESA